MERVYGVSSSIRRLSGCLGGKGVSITVRADLVKHVTLAPMCARCVLAGEEALEQEGQGSDSSLCLTISSSQPKSLDELFDLVSGGCSCLVRARAKKPGPDTLHRTGKEG